MSCRRDEDVINLVIDSGSQGNFIKISILPENSQIEINDTITVKGVSGEPMTSLGTARLILCSRRVTLHIMENNFTTPYDGILGSRFLSDTETIIDFNKKTLSVNGRVIHYKKNCAKGETSRVGNFNFNI